MRHPLFVSLVTAGLVAGCALPGERAGSVQCTDDGCTSSCPQGELCSADTPQGLHFAGGTVFDQLDGGPRFTAAGGTQTLRVLNSTSLSDDFELPFDAAGTGVVEIAATEPPQVTIRATGAGDGYLRILEPGTEHLYDRIKLDAAKVQSVGFLPYDELFITPALPQGSYRVLAGGLVYLGARLRSSADDVLVDESMLLEVDAGGTETGEIHRWDVLEFAPAASGEVAVRVTLGDGSVHKQAFPISAGIDEIVRVVSALHPEEDTATAPKESRHFCFRGLDAGAPVTGILWAYSTDDSDVHLDNQGPCVLASSSVLGTHTFTVEAAGQKLDFTFEVITKAAGKAPTALLPQAGEPAAAPGERFGLFFGDALFD
ncbi:MAG: hypothetical protein R3B70_29655 [Polyangiaceae bacterium]